MLGAVHYKKCEVENGPCFSHLTVNLYCLVHCCTGVAGWQNHCLCNRADTVSVEVLKPGAEEVKLQIHNLVIHIWEEMNTPDVLQS